MSRGLLTDDELVLGGVDHRGRQDLDLVLAWGDVEEQLEEVARLLVVRLLDQVEAVKVAPVDEHPMSKTMPVGPASPAQAAEAGRSLGQPEALSRR